MAFMFRVTAPEKSHVAETKLFAGNKRSLE